MAAEKIILCVLFEEFLNEISINTCLILQNTLNVQYSQCPQGLGYKG